MNTNSSGYSINITKLANNSNENNKTKEKKEDNCEVKEQKNKEKKVGFQCDLLNKSALNLKSRNSLKKSVLKPKQSFNKKNHFLNKEFNHQRDKKFNQTLFKIDNIEYSKSSLNVKNKLSTKSFLNDKKSFYNKSFFKASDSQNKSFHKQGKLIKSKKNFLKLINSSKKDNIYKETQISHFKGNEKDLSKDLEEDSLHLIQKKLQNKILDMGKEAEFLEFEISSLEKSINQLNLGKKNPIKKSKKDEDKKNDKNSLIRHQTFIHKKIINNVVNNNSGNSSSDDWLFGNDISFISKKKKGNFSNKNLIRNIYQINKMNGNRKNLNNNLRNNISKKYYKINLMKSKANGRRSSINHFLKSTHTFKSTIISRSKTSSHTKRKSINDDESTPKNLKNKNIIPEFIKKKVALYNVEKFRILSHKKLVYDSLDDEEIIEDAINDNFYLKPDDKIVLIIDSFILFFSYYNMIYQPLKLVLNNCDISNKVTSIDFDNISNIFIDFLFICDFIINFFKAYYNFDEQLVIRSEKIILNYMKTYFIIDLISAIPYYTIINITSSKNQKTLVKTIKCSKYYNHEINDIYQIIELLKLIKLVKCISNQNIISSYINNILNKISFFETWSFLLNTAFLSLMVLHLTACIHIFISSTAFPNWIVYKNLDTSNFITIYLSSIYFLITTVTSVGYGDITGNSITEFIFQIFLLIIGIIAYSWLISSISNYVKENNQQNEVFNQKIDILNEIKLEHPSMTKELFDKIYLHLEYINLSQKKDKSSLLDSLPPSVKRPLLYEMYKPIIENFSFFKNFKNSEFVHRVISKLKPVLAVKNDLLLEQGEIIEDAIFVKQGRLSLEVKIDIAHPEKSVEKLLNEEYFFGIENNELYQKNAFGGIFNMTSSIYNQSIVNKKNLYNLYSGNTFNENNNLKGIKSIVTNNCGEPEIQKHPNSNINYIHLRILDIRKNEHFGALIMFLNKRSPLTLRVKTKKAELFFLKKIDAVQISTSYPNIWKRVNKKSFHNLKQIKKIMKKIIKHFCETYGIDFDFGTKFLNKSSIKELKKLKSRQSLEKKIQIGNKFKDPRRASVGILNTQLQKFQQHFPKQTRIITTKTNFEKDIEELIPKSFERNNNIKKIDNNINNINENEKEDKSVNSNNNYNKNENYKDNNSQSKKDLSEEKENPIDCSVSIIKIKKKESTEYDRPSSLKKSNKNKKEIDNSNSNKNSITVNKDGKSLTKLKNLKISNQNGTEKSSSVKKIVYGEEETNNLIKFFGTPYYPEDINDEVYPGENFDILSQRDKINYAYEQEYSPANNLLLSYDNSKNNISKNNKLLPSSSINNIEINNKLNNLTINNNYITNNVFSNINSSKYNQNLSIFKFDLYFKSHKLLGQINESSKMLNFTIDKESFEISPNKSMNIFNNENASNEKNILVKNKNNCVSREENLQIRKQKKKRISHNDFDIQKVNTNVNRVRHNSCINNQKENFKKESESYSSSESLSFDSYSINSSVNKKDNLFIFSPKARKERNSLKSFNSTEKKKNNNKIFKITQNIIIKINSNYENLNKITNGLFSKSKNLQNCIKNILINKIKKHKKEETPSPKKIRNASSLKLFKLKTMARKMPDKFTKNNLYKITIAENKLKKTEVKSLFKKPMISDIHDQNSIVPVKKNNNGFKDSSKYSSCTHSISKKSRIKKKNDEFLLDYVNKNIRDDNAVLNNPGKFYNGLFSNIMKKVTIKNNIQNKK